MFRIDDPSAAATLPVPEAALAEGYWTEGNPVGGVPATLERASWFNMVQEELRAIVVAGGLTPSKTVYNQSLTAIQAFVQGNAMKYAADTGAANAAVVSYSPAVLALKDGMVLSFKVKASNTGVTTLNVNGLGAQPIVGAEYVSLQGGELIANGICAVVWNATITGWVLLGSTGGSLPVAPGFSSNQAVNFGQSFGLGQTWQNVIGSRVSGTNYTNSTGRPIFVSAVNQSAAGGGLTAVVNGITVANPLNATETVRLVCSFVVPPGGTYSITLVVSTGFTAWAELR